MVHDNAHKSDGVCETSKGTNTLKKKVHFHIFFFLCIQFIQLQDEKIKWCIFKNATFNIFKKFLHNSYF